MLLLAALTLSGCAGAGKNVAAGEETIAASEGLGEGLEPVYASRLQDGSYEIRVDSSSSMFPIAACRLTVRDGAMSARMTMGGTGYSRLYMGTAAQAAAASQEGWISPEEDGDGAVIFEVPVEALDQEVACSAFSRRKEKWYDRTLVFRSDSLPAEAFQEGELVTAESLGLKDGAYLAEVALSGGSGRASVESPASLRVEGGKVWARIVWSSSNYDYMKVEGERYDREEGEETSTFEIPVTVFDRGMAVIADTVAMSEPHEIEYTLTFDSDSIRPAGSLSLRHATQFSAEYGEDGCVLITIGGRDRYLAVPPGAEPSEELAEGAVQIPVPVTSLYLTATSAMDLIRALDCVDRVTLSGTQASGWYIEEAREAMEAGRMLYAGKYSAPDYERILETGCSLAVESTMIYHTPEVKEQLERLGIPVLVERSSYESDPLGRMEWLKLYGILLGKEELAEQLFEEEEARLAPVLEQEKTGKTAAFFYITSNGAVNVRKSGDYVARMIEMAGGVYVPGNLGNDNALSTMNMQLEAFYATAKDADYLIYNSTIDGELSTREQLLDKSSLLADFKAVREGNVWCTGRNMFQETMGLGEMVLDLHRMLTQKDPDPEEMTYLHRLR